MATHSQRNDAALPLMLETVERIRELAEAEHTVEIAGYRLVQLCDMAIRSRSVPSETRQTRTYEDGIDAAADYVASRDNPWREGGDTIGMSDDIRALKNADPQATREEVARPESRTDAAQSPQTAPAESASPCVVVPPKVIAFLIALAAVNEVDRMETDGRMKEFINKIIVGAKEAVGLLEVAATPKGNAG